METLARLFGSETKVKMMKLFIFNDGHVYTSKVISERVKSPISKVRREIGNLNKMGLIRKRSIKSQHGFVLNKQFPNLIQIRNFLIDLEQLGPKEILKKLSRAGSIKLVVTAGIFIHDDESRADLLVVVDGVKKGKLENVIRGLEAEVGKELRYAFFTTDEFRYRLSMYDKLVRDMLDYPHTVLMDKLGILEEGGV